MEFTLCLRNGLGLAGDRLCGLDNLGSVEGGLGLPVALLDLPPLLLDPCDPLVALALDPVVKYALPLGSLGRSLVDEHDPSFASVRSGCGDGERVNGPGELLDEPLEPVHLERGPEDEQQIRRPSQVVRLQRANQVAVRVVL